MRLKFTLLCLLFTAFGFAQKGVDYGQLTARPHHCTDKKEMAKQYKKNKSQWDAAFKWLAENDLLAIDNGKYPIAGTSLVVSVEDSENGELKTRQSESHYHHVDLQYVVKGTERFALLDHNSSKPNCKWRNDVIHYDYDIKKTKFMDSVPGKFFVFFPKDWHIAKVATDLADQHIRVVVIKLDYID